MKILSLKKDLLLLLIALAGALEACTFLVPLDNKLWSAGEISALLASAEMEAAKGETQQWRRVIRLSADLFQRRLDQIIALRPAQDSAEQHDRQKLEQSITSLRTLETLTALRRDTAPYQALQTGMQALSQLKSGDNNLQVLGQHLFTSFNRLSSGRHWTLAVYLAADNSHYPFSLETIAIMEAAFNRLPKGSEKIEVIVLFDGTPHGDSKLLRIRPDVMNLRIVSEVLDDKSEIIPENKEIDSGDSEILSRFAEYAFRNFPARYQGLLISQAGDAIRPRIYNPEASRENSFFEIIGSIPADSKRTSNGSLNSFAVDDHGSRMLLSELDRALAKVVKTGGKALDIFGFEHNQMMQLEAAYQLEGVAKLLIASEKTNILGWDFKTFLEQLCEQHEMTPEQLAHTLVESFISSMALSNEDAVMTALGLENTNQKVIPALNDLADLLLIHLPTQKQLIQAARRKAQRFEAKDTVDLGDFLRLYVQAGPPEPIRQAITRLHQSMEAARVAHGSTGTSTKDATGFQLYFPEDGAPYDMRYDDATQFRFAETRSWQTFLKDFAKSGP